MNESRCDGRHAPAPSLLGPDQVHNSFPYSPPSVPPPAPDAPQNAPTPQGAPQTPPADSAPTAGPAYNFAAWLKALATQCGRQSQHVYDLRDRYEAWAFKAEELGSDIAELGIKARKVAESIEHADFPAVVIPPKKGA